ncbi:MAG: hypothetical protein ACOC5T_04580 [Elusimicrobiota bacterium]
MKDKEFDIFKEDLEACVDFLKGRNLNDKNKERFSKKVRMCVARYFNQRLSDTNNLKFSHEGKSLLIQYPYDNEFLTLIKLDINEVNKN